MENRTILLKPVRALLGMNFYIPEYQRGYRWEAQQAIDLLEDIYTFARNTSEDSEEIYCIQPLVVSKKETEEEIVNKCKTAEKLADIERYIKGSWNVVDGQQRLTTIYLLLCRLSVNERYEIDYRTRDKSEEFLRNIESKTQSEAEKNIDYYHMYRVYSTIKEWLDEKTKEDRELIESTLLDRVNFIWYQVEKDDEIATFKRLNIGKIPLTDSELIKALFLNRTNFTGTNSEEVRATNEREIEMLQHKIAVEWDAIEYTLQNDEFWAFIHSTEYSKPTRIDFILDFLCEKDKYELLPRLENYRNTNKRKRRDAARAKKAALEKKIGDDEHKTFRYFYEALQSNKADTEKSDRINKFWLKVKKYYQILNEWYQDYELFHYIGYLTCIDNNPENLIAKYLEIWEGTETKAKFVATLKNDISEQLKSRSWISDIKTYTFEEDGNKSKRECVDILLLHNIETIIQQNTELVSDAKYNLPNFSKFPFHLYKKEKWQVEHIRPNAGYDLKGDKAKLYLLLAKPYFTYDKELTQEIDSFLNDNSSEMNLTDILEKISQEGGSLPDEDKNKIWNYVLLDEATNKEYGNQIFPVKREFIINKENGKKIKYSWGKGNILEKTVVPEVAFVPPCTKNVFSKLYTDRPKTMINWNIEDAEAYLEDMKEKLTYYLD